MNDTIVDSSVLAKVVIAEPDSDGADQLFSKILSSGHVLIALDLALVETTNAIWKQWHRQIATAEEARVAQADLLALPLQIEPAINLLPQALELSIRYDLAIYDALFVALSLERKMAAVTADESLCKSLNDDIPTIELLRDWQ
jgi:predicted nucleic acid-binding protein